MGQMTLQQDPRSFQAGAPSAAYPSIGRGPPPRRFSEFSGHQSLQPQFRATAGSGAPFSEAQFQQMQQMQQMRGDMRATELQQMRGELPMPGDFSSLRAAELQGMRDAEIHMRAAELQMRGAEIPQASIQAEMRARASMSNMNRQMHPSGLQGLSAQQRQAAFAASIPLRESLVHNVRAPPSARMTLDDARNLEAARAKAAHGAPGSTPAGNQKSPIKAANIQDAASALLTMGSIIKQSEDSADEEQKQDSVDEDDDEKAAKATKKPFPTRLALPEDEEKLNSMHCFLRAELLEVFLVENAPKPPPKPEGVEENSLEALEAELSHSPPPNSAKNRIGIRCVHCQRARKIYGQECEAPMAVFYPKSLAELYRLVTSWQRVHLRKCRNLPKNVRATYQTLRATDKTRGKTHYWVTSAKKLGLKDSKRRSGGIVFDP